MLQTILESSEHIQSLPVIFHIDLIVVSYLMRIIHYRAHSHSKAIVFIPGCFQFQDSSYRCSIFRSGIGYQFNLLDIFRVQTVEFVQVADFPVIDIDKRNAFSQHFQRAILLLQHSRQKPDYVHGSTCLT